MINYWTIFDEYGGRITTYLEDVHGIENIPPEAIPLNETDWQLYCTGKYKRNMETGEPEEIIPEPQSDGSAPPSTEDRLVATEAAILAMMEVIG